MEIKLVDQNDELLQILQIQAENHLHNLHYDVASENGFVTVKHSYDMIRKMNEKAKQVIAKVNDKVIAYALVMLKEFKNDIPILIPMFNSFENIRYKGKCLSDLNYYVMGQICVQDAFKRQGIFKKLYAMHREAYGSVFDFCITEVSTRNTPSILAHKKIGFKTIHTFSDHSDVWHILLWDWQ